MVALSDLSTKQRVYAGLIYGVAVERFGANAGLAAVYGIACSGAEASLTNWENAGTATQVGRLEGRQLNTAERTVARRSLGLGDGVPPWGDNLDSMGLFAQRPMSGWGTPEQIMRPIYAAGKFFDGLAKVVGWTTRPAAEVIAKVQGYYDPAVYAAWLTVARELVDILTPVNPAVPTQSEDIMATPEDLENAIGRIADKVVEKLTNHAGFMTAVATNVWTKTLDDRQAAVVLAQLPSKIAVELRTDPAFLEAIGVSVWTQKLDERSAADIAVNGPAYVAQKLKTAQ